MQCRNVDVEGNGLLLFCCIERAFDDSRASIVLDGDEYKFVVLDEAVGACRVRCMCATWCLSNTCILQALCC